MLEKPGRTVRLARALRRAMTVPEVALWAALRTRPQGLKFRRQHPAGRYVLDFYCASARLAVEVDGEAHARGGRPHIDARRDSTLAQHGVAVLRIPAIEVLSDLDAVVRYIVRAAQSRVPLHHPAARGGPPPHAARGED